MRALFIFTFTLGLMLTASCADETDETAGKDAAPLDHGVDLAQVDAARDASPLDSTVPDRFSPDAAMGTLQWVVTGGGDKDESLPYNDSLRVDTQGNIYISGSFVSTTFTLGTYTLTSKGKKDLYVAKLSPAGQVLWVTGIGGIEDDSSDGLCLDAKGNPHVVGNFSKTVQAGSTSLTAKGTTDMLVASLAPADGKVLWAAQSGSANNAKAWICTPDSGGGLIVTGGYDKQITLGSTTLTSKGGQDIFFTRLSSDGKTFSGAASMGGTGSDYVEDIEIGSAGEVYAVGYFTQTLTAGSTTLTSAGGYDLFAAKLSKSFAPEWVVGGGGTLDDKLIAVELDQSGALMVGGFVNSPGGLGAFVKVGSVSIPLVYKGYRDMVMARILPSGTVDWAKAAYGQKVYAGTRNYGHDMINSMAMDAKGRVLYTGMHFFDTMDFLGIQVSSKYAWNTLVARASTKGAADWLVSWGGTDDTNGFNSGHSIAMDSKGDVVLFGAFTGNVNYGAFPLKSKGGKDIFVLKLTPPL